jgi:hypothetical protein
MIGLAGAASPYRLRQEKRHLDRGGVDIKITSLFSGRVKSAAPPIAGKQM